MPDTQLTLTNLKEHLRKHAAIYIIGLIIALVLSNLAWTMTSPRVSGDQQVLIYMADSYSNPQLMEDIAADMLARTQAFDESLRQVEFQSLLYTDPDVDYTGTILLMTRLSVGEGDVFLASGDAMEALVHANALLPLDDYVAGGWLAEYDLEPYYATVTDGETGAETTLLAGLRLDRVDALSGRGAFNNRGAFLAVAVNSDNAETAMKSVEFMLAGLMDAPAEGGRSDD